MALAIFAAMSSAVLISWPARFDDRIDVVSERIRLSLIEARDAAMRTGEPTQVGFRLRDRIWTGHDGRTFDLPSATDVTVTAARQPTGSEDLRISFMPQGSSTGGTIVLSNEAEHMEITVDWLTSRIGVVKTDE